MNNVGAKKAKEETIEEAMFVTISLSGENFGVDVTKIQEIIGMPETSLVPNAMPYMKGVTSLRGRVIPLVDLRLKFNMQEKTYDKLTVVLIAEIRDTLVGLIVDSVSDVINVASSDIQKTPHFSTNISTDCIKGVVKIEEEIFIIIDVDRIFNKEELSTIKS